MSLEAGLTKDDSTEESEDETLADVLDNEPSRSISASLLQRSVFAVAGVCVMGLVVLVVPSKREVTSFRLQAEPQITGLDETLFGTVDAGIYTYGAPGTAEPALQDLSRKDGCFAGLRTWTEDILTPATKEVDAAAISDQLDHPRVATLRLHDESQSSHFAPCPGEVHQPFSKGNQFADWRLHWEPKYKPRLEHVSLLDKDVSDQEPFRTAYLYNRIAYKQYDSTEHAKKHIKERLGGHWNIVSRVTLVAGAASLYDEDPIMLVQSSETYDCVLAFAGLNNYGNELATATDVRMAPFCGFNAVHAGYRDELRRMIKELWPLVRPKIAKCSRVACTGHSMGGSLCDLFAACANSGRHQDPDFLAQSWKKEIPDALPEISDCGTMVYQDGAERRCKCPPCPK